MKETTNNLLVFDSNLTVKVVTPNVPAKHDVLFLHGAGMATIDRYSYLSNLVCELGYRALLFNFTGHGTSSGSLTSSSLELRDKEAQNIISAYAVKEPISIIASSMGGYNAIKLTTKYQIERLILFCPAAYAREAYSVPFTEEFSNIIRKPLSWRNSDAFDHISRFTGELIIIIGKDDEIIPYEIVQRLYDSAVLSSKRTIVQIDGGPHALHSWLMKPEQNIALNQVLTLITESLSH